MDRDWQLGENRDTTSCCLRDSGVALPPFSLHDSKRTLGACRGQMERDEARDADRHDETDTHVDRLTGTDTSHRLTGTDVSHRLTGTDTSHRQTGTDVSHKLTGTDYASHRQTGTDVSHRQTDNTLQHTEKQGTHGQTDTGRQTGRHTREASSLTTSSGSPRGRIYWMKRRRNSYDADGSPNKRPSTCCVRILKSTAKNPWPCKADACSDSMPESGAKGGSDAHSRAKCSSTINSGGGEGDAIVVTPQPHLPFVSTPEVEVAAHHSDTVLHPSPTAVHAALQQCGHITGEDSLDLDDSDGLPDIDLGARLSHSFSPPADSPPLRLAQQWPCGGRVGRRHLSPVSSGKEGQLQLERGHALIPLQLDTCDPGRQFGKDSGCGRQFHQDGDSTQRQLHPDSCDSGRYLHPDSGDSGRQLHPDSGDSGRQQHPDSGDSGRQLHPYSGDSGRQQHPDSGDSGRQLHPYSSDSGSRLHPDSGDSGRPLHPDSGDSGRQLQLKKSDTRRGQDQDDDHTGRQQQHYGNNQERQFCGNDNAQKIVQISTIFPQLVDSHIVALLNRFSGNVERCIAAILEEPELIGGN